MPRWSEDDLKAYLSKRSGKTANDILKEVSKRKAARKKRTKKSKAKVSKGSSRKTPERDDNGVMRIELPVSMSNGNDGQTKHWGKTVKFRKEYDLAIASNYYKPITPSFRQDLIITRVLKKGERFWDADSVLRGSAKQLIDSLVDYGFLQDDGPKWVRTAIGKQDDSRRDEGPITVVEFIPTD